MEVASVVRGIAWAALIIAIGGLLAVKWFAPRWKSGKGGRSITVQRSLALGARQRLVVVQLEGRRIALGVTPTEVRLLLELGPSGSADLPGGRKAGDG